MRVKSLVLLVEVGVELVICNGQESILSEFDLPTMQLEVELKGQDQLVGPCQQLEVELEVEQQDICGCVELVAAQQQAICDLHLWCRCQLLESSQ